MQSAGLYIHVPFCFRKCPYCAFPSQTLEPDLVSLYLDSLQTEIGLAMQTFPWSRASFSSVYLGGGTPTALSPAQISCILELCREGLHITPEAEVTVEANPGTVDRERLEMLRESGANRLSLGVQSFRDEELQDLGRIHTAREALEAFAMIRSSGFDNVGIDLLFATPGQNLNSWRETLAVCVTLAPEHISTYCLTPEPETPFGKSVLTGQTARPTPELEAEMYELAMDFLEARGYEHYEVANFARSDPGPVEPAAVPGGSRSSREERMSGPWSGNGERAGRTEWTRLLASTFRCQHNLHYWLGGDYLGVGPGAHSHFQGRRWANSQSIKEWATSLRSGQAPAQMEEVLTAGQKFEEMVMLGLRMRDGIDLECATSRFPRETASVVQELAALQGLELVSVSGTRLSLTRKGLLLADDVCAGMLKGIPGTRGAAAREGWAKD